MQRYKSPTKGDLSLQQSSSLGNYGVTKSSVQLCDSSFGLRASDKLCTFIIYGAGICDNDTFAFHVASKRIINFIYMTPCSRLIEHYKEKSL